MACKKKRRAGHGSVYGVGGDGNRRALPWICPWKPDGFPSIPTFWVKGIRTGKSQCSIPARWTLNTASSWAICWDRAAESQCSRCGADLGPPVIHCWAEGPVSCGCRQVQQSRIELLGDEGNFWLGGVVSPPLSPSTHIHPHLLVPVTSVLTKHYRFLGFALI